jgi:bacillithiol system protein YtxJ
MNWTKIINPEQLESLQAESKNQPVLIFKHSTSCSISRATLDRLERNWKQEELNNVKPYFIDLLSFRSISNSIAEIFDITHESPQLILLHQGRAVYHKSHFEIEYGQVKKAIHSISDIKS